MTWILKNIGLCAVALALFAAAAPITDYQLQILHTMERLEAQTVTAAPTAAFAHVTASALDFHLHPLKTKKVRS